MKMRIVQALVLLSASAAAQAQFKANPTAFLQTAGLTSQEQQIVLTCDTESIRLALGDLQSTASMIKSPF